jgi:hypothetical protein
MSLSEQTFFNFAFLNFWFRLLKPHGIQFRWVLVPAGTSKSTLRRRGIQAVTRVMAYIANAVICDIVFNNAYWRLRDS